MFLDKVVAPCTCMTYTLYTPLHATAKLHPAGASAAHRQRGVISRPFAQMAAQGRPLVPQASEDASFRHVRRVAGYAQSRSVLPHEGPCAPGESLTDLLDQTIAWCQGCDRQERAAVYHVCLHELQQFDGCAKLLGKSIGALSFLAQGLNGHRRTSNIYRSTLITASSVDVSAQRVQDGHASLLKALCRCISLL